jgi:hypothetical protein
MIHCECCGAGWSEGERLRALQTIRWHQTKPFECCGSRHSPLMEYDQNGMKTMMVALMQSGAGQNQSGMLSTGPFARTAAKRWITITPVIRHQSCSALAER